jgi:hypothetical protein
MKYEIKTDWTDRGFVAGPDKSLDQAHALWRFARGMAFSGEGQTDKAAAEREAFMSGGVHFAPR